MINTDLIAQRVQVRKRRVRPVVVVGMSDAGGSCDVSYAIDVLDRPLCEGPAGQAVKEHQTAGGRGRQNNTPRGQHSPDSKVGSSQAPA